MFLDLHYSDPSRTGEHQDFIEIRVRGGWGIGGGRENFFIPGFCSVSMKRLRKICNLARNPTVSLETASIVSQRTSDTDTNSQTAGAYGKMKVSFKVLSRCF